MINFETITKQVQEIINEQIGKQIQIDDILLESGVDSISIIEVLISIEETFNIEFQSEMLNYKLLKSIRTVSEYVYKLLNDGKIYEKN